MTSRLSILVAAGLSGDDARVLARGVQLAAETGGELSVIAVAEDDDPLRSARRRKLLRQTLADLGASERTEVHVVAGDALPVIAEFASDRLADILLVDHGAVDGKLLEPLASAVACPLLVVRNARMGPYRKVLIGAAPTAGCRCALAAAMTVAPIARFILLRVVNFPGGYIPDSLPEIPSEQEVAAILGDFTLPEGQHDWMTRCGKARAEIVYTAREVRADLVALGNSRREGLERMLLGSVALDAVGSLPCDVIIAHSEDHLR